MSQFRLETELDMAGYLRYQIMGMVYQQFIQIVVVQQQL